MNGWKIARTFAGLAFGGIGAGVVELMRPADKPASDGTPSPAPQQPQGHREGNASGNASDTEGAREVR